MEKGKKKFVYIPFDEKISVFVFLAFIFDSKGNNYQRKAEYCRVDVIC